MPDDPDYRQEIILADAMSPDSPIHSCFEWDDLKASRNYRLDQARKLMRSYEIVVISRTSEVTISPASVRIITPDRKSAFVSTPVAMSNDENKRFVLQEARVLLAGVEKRLRLLQDISPVILGRLRDLEAAIEAEMQDPIPKPKKKGHAAATLRN